MSSNQFKTDDGTLEIQVEGDHIYVFSHHCCGEEMTDMAEVEALRDELTRFLERNVSQR